MPEQTHPPYVSGATTIPRQLQRWLDVNPQNGRLRRTETYVQVPTFNINHVWNGYSEIVGEYHFSSPNQLSLKLLNIANLIPSGTNYTLCVSYISGVGTVQRYSLIRGQGDLFYFNLPPYDGQRLINEFAIEIWNTSQVTCSEVVTTTIYTSVIGNLDYRYGVDGPLASAILLCMGQQPPGSTVLMPIGVNMELWLDGNVTWTEHLWTDRLGSLVFTSSSDLSSVTPPNLVETGGSKYTGNAANPLSSWVYLVPDDTNNYPFLTFDNGSGQITQVGIDASSKIFVNVSTAGTHTGTYSLVAGKGYIIYVDSIRQICNVYDAGMLVQLDGISTDGFGLSAPSVAITVGNESSTMSVRAILCYNDTTLDPFYSTSIFPYMQSLPANARVMTVPLVFDPCGTIQPNPTQQGVIAVG